MADLQSFLFILLVTALASNQVISESFDECKNKGWWCGFMVENPASNLMGPYPNVEKACNTSRNIMTCLGKCKEIVLEDSSQLKVVEEYCQDSDKRKIFKNSCFKEHHKIERMQSGTLQCYDDTMGNFQYNERWCPLQSMMDCVDEKTRDLCGQQIIPFVNALTRPSLEKKLMKDILGLCYVPRDNVDDDE